MGRNPTTKKTRDYIIREVKEKKEIEEKMYTKAVDVY